MTEDMVYVPTKALEESGGNPVKGHVDPDCQMLHRTDGGITQLTPAEAEEECSRMAGCCWRIPALEDVDQEVTP